MRNYILIIALFFSATTIAQTTDTKNKKLKYFCSQREYHYKAVYLEKNGDTISNQYIIVDPIEIPYYITPETYTSVLIKYTYSSEDSIRSINNPIYLDEKSKKKIGYYTWTNDTIVMAIENENHISLYHAFSCNQYTLTEIAPHPDYWFDSKPDYYTAMSRSIKSAAIKSRFKLYYTVHEVESKTYEFGEVKCRKIESYSTSKKYGINRNTFYFNEEYGFTELVYEFFNGQKMFLTLEKLIIEN